MFRSLYVILFLMCFNSIVSQENIFRNSKKLTISNGLVHNGVTSILEDSKGVLWFGTYAGLNRYDGYKITTFKNTTNNRILSNNRVRSINEDGNGNLWIGTDDGISFYNISTQKFIKLNNFISNSEKINKGKYVIKQIVVSKQNDHIICLTESNGLLLFNNDYTFLGHFKFTENLYNKRVKIVDGVQLNNQHYALATNVGLIIFDVKNKQFKHVLRSEIRNCTSITVADNENLIVTLSRGVAIVEYELFESLVSFKLIRKKFLSKLFTCSMLDYKNNLWLGNQRKGVMHVNNFEALKNNKPLKIQYFKDGLEILKSSRLISTSKKFCWLASFDQGVYQFKIDGAGFKSSNSIPNNKFWNKESRISNIELIENSEVYLSSGTHGVSKFNLKSKKFEALPVDFYKKLKTLYLDSKKNIWGIDGDKKVYRIKKGSKNVELVNIHELDNTGFRSFTSEHRGNENVWIGDKNNVSKISFDKKENISKIEYINSNPYFSKVKVTSVRCVYADPKNNDIWIGTSNYGLFRVRNKKNTSIEELKVDHYILNENNEFSIPSNFVTVVLRLPNGELWIGTEGGGVSKVIEKKNTLKFKSFTIENGLSNDEIKNMLFDNESNLWISTNNGLNKLNIKDFSIQSFKESDGLPFEDFSYPAKKLDNGTMIFAGVNGFCYFNPKNVKQKELLPKIEFESFKIFNKLVKPGDTLNNRVVLNKVLGELSALELKYNENVFSLDVNSLHFSNPENHLLKYKLTPINDEWVEVPSSQRTIVYSGLQPGKYKLKVMASNSLNEWSEVKTLNINIKPPFWRTSLAYMLYFLIVVLIGYIINRIIVKIHLLNHKLEIEQIEKNHEKEVNEHKLRFFSNISHEIKTPLTLITSPINNLYERFKGNPELGEKLGMVLRQSKKIQQLVEQVQDLRRADANMLKMKYSRFQFNDFMDVLVNDFSYSAKSKNKKLELVGEGLPIIVAADKDKLEKIFNNLLSNAFKYTSENDTIKVVYKSNEKDLIITVSDTGRGIDREDLTHVFERFYQSHKLQNEHLGGSGIGLAFSKKLVEMHYGYINAESELDKGTTITVQLPIVKETVENEKLLSKDVKLPKENEISLDNIVIDKKWLTKAKVDGEFADALIFYAEDNDELRNYVTSFLSKHFKIKSFKNGQECLDALEDEWPDIIISDVQMPVLNGLDLCISVKSDLKTSHIPVVLLTALTNLVDHLQGIKDGADAYIKKPFNLERLFTTIEALLTNRKQLRERYKVGIPLTRDNKNNRNDNAFLEKFYSLIDENLDNQDFDLKDLARDLCLSKSAFYQKVNTLTNQTPFELIKNYRLKRASEFLTQENLSVSEVFLMTGFKNRTHFSTKFKEKFKVSPSKYASQIKNKE